MKLISISLKTTSCVCFAHPQSLGRDARIVRLHHPSKILAGWDDEVLQKSFEVWGVRG